MNLGDKSLTEGRVRCSVDETERKNRASISSSVEIEGTYVSKNLDEAVRLQSEKRQEWIRETLQGIEEDASSAPAWPAHQPRRSPGETGVRRPIVA